jgi:hypothetical protein
VGKKQLKCPTPTTNAQPQDEKNLNLVFPDPLEIGRHIDNDVHDFFHR